MFIAIGKPRLLAEISREVRIQSLKDSLQIAVVDDEPFSHAESLRLNGFKLVELGPDVRTIEQFETYSIIVCDIRGVGHALGSRFQGAHVIRELRKRYPDKYIIAFTGMMYDASYNDCLAAADISMTKDAGFDPWVAVLEGALKEVGIPMNRWMRFRTYLAKTGLDAYKLFKIEQAFIAAVQKDDAKLLTAKVASIEIGADVRDMVSIFAKAALPFLAKVVTNSP